MKLIFLFNLVLQSKIIHPLMSFSNLILTFLIIIFSFESFFYWFYFFNFIIWHLIYWNLIFVFFPGLVFLFKRPRPWVYIIFFLLIFFYLITYLITWHWFIIIIIIIIICKIGFMDLCFLFYRVILISWPNMWVWRVISSGFALFLGF
jgi:hypothetical protein